MNHLHRHYDSVHRQTRPPSPQPRRVLITLRRCLYDCVSRAELLRPDREIIWCLCRMVVMRIPFVVPWRWDWLLILLLIGLFGFGGQVSSAFGSPNPSNLMFNTGSAHDGFAEGDSGKGNHCSLRTGVFRSHAARLFATNYSTTYRSSLLQCLSISSFTPSLPHSQYSEL